MLRDCKFDNSLFSVKKVEIPFPVASSAVAISSSGLLAVGTENGSVLVFSLSEDSITLAWTAEESHGGKVSGLEFSKDCRYLVSCAQPGDSGHQHGSSGLDELRLLRVAKLPEAVGADLLFRDIISHEDLFTLRGPSLADELPSFQALRVASVESAGGESQDSRDLECFFSDTRANLSNVLSPAIFESFGFVISSTDDGDVYVSVPGLIAFESHLLASERTPIFALSLLNAGPSLWLAGWSTKEGSKIVLLDGTGSLKVKVTFVPSSLFKENISGYLFRWLGADSLHLFCPFGFLRVRVDLEGVSDTGCGSGLIAFASVVDQVVFPSPLILRGIHAVSLCSNDPRDPHEGGGCLQAECLVSVGGSGLRFDLISRASPDLRLHFFSHGEARLSNSCLFASEIYSLKYCGCETHMSVLAESGANCLWLVRPRNFEAQILWLLHQENFQTVATLIHECARFAPASRVAPVAVLEILKTRQLKYFEFLPGLLSDFVPSLDQWLLFLSFFDNDRDDLEGAALFLNSIRSCFEGDETRSAIPPTARSEYLRRVAGSLVAAKSRTDLLVTFDTFLTIFSAQSAPSSLTNELELAFRAGVAVSSLLKREALLACLDVCLGSRPDVFAACSERLSVRIDRCNMARRREETNASADLLTKFEKRALGETLDAQIILVSCFGYVSSFARRWGYETQSRVVLLANASRLFGVDARLAASTFAPIVADRAALLTAEAITEALGLQAQSLNFEFWESYDSNAACGSNFRAVFEFLHCLFQFDPGSFPIDMFPLAIFLAVDYNPPATFAVLCSFFKRKTKLLELLRNQQRCSNANLPKPLYLSRFLAFLKVMAGRFEISGLESCFALVAYFSKTGNEVSNFFEGIDTGAVLDLADFLGDSCLLEDFVRSRLSSKAREPSELIRFLQELATKLDRAPFRLSLQGPQPSNETRVLTPEYIMAQNIFTSRPCPNFAYQFRRLLQDISSRKRRLGALALAELASSMTVRGSVSSRCAQEICQGTRWKLKYF